MHTHIHSSIIHDSQEQKQPSVKLSKMSGQAKGCTSIRWRWWDGVTGSMRMSLSKLREIEEDREAWRAAVRGVTKSRTRLSNEQQQTRKQSNIIIQPKQGGNSNTSAT